MDSLAPAVAFRKPPLKSLEIGHGPGDDVRSQLEAQQTLVAMVVGCAERQVIFLYPVICVANDVERVRGLFRQRLRSTLRRPGWADRSSPAVLSLYCAVAPIFRLSIGLKDTPALMLSSCRCSARRISELKSERLTRREAAVEGSLCPTRRNRTYCRSWTSPPAACQNIGKLDAVLQPVKAAG